MWKDVDSERGFFPDALTRFRDLTHALWRQLGTAAAIIVFGFTQPLSHGAAESRDDDLPPGVAELLGSMKTHAAAGERREAMAASYAALQRCEKLAGAESAAFGTCLHETGAVLLDLGNFKEAREILEQALAVREKAAGAQAFVTLKTRNHLAQTCYQLGDLVAAEKHFRRALADAEKGNVPLQIASTANNFSMLLASRGAFQEAESLLLRARAIQEKELGLKHHDTVITLGNLATLRTATGDLAGAEDLARKVLEITEEISGGDSIDTAGAASNLATILCYRGKYPEAARLLRRALAIVETRRPANHPEIATVTMNLAMLYWQMGDAAQALPLSKRALAMIEHNALPDSPDNGIALHNLGLALQASGNDTEAVRMLERAFELFGRVLPPGHPQIVKTGSALCAAYQLIGELDKADETMVRVGKTLQQMTNLNQPEVGSAFNNVGTLMLKSRKPAEAVTMLETALRIWKATEGDLHPDVGTCLDNLAFAEFDSGHPDRAIDYARQARGIREKTLGDILSFASEAQRDQFQKPTSIFMMPASLGSADDLAIALFRWKGVVLDSILEDRALARASSQSGIGGALERLREARQQLQQLLLSAPAQWSEAAEQQRRQQIAHWQSVAAEMEGQLAGKVAALGRTRRALAVEPANVQAALAADEALVEFVRYHHYAGPDDSEPRYGAVVVPPRGKISWVQLGKAGEIESRVALYQKSARGETDAHTLQSVLHSLHAAVWQPIADALPHGTRHVIVAPDAALNLLSFATLLDPQDAFVAERFELRYVASGRDLLREMHPIEERRMVLFSDPDFAAGRSATAPRGAAGSNAKRGTPPATPGAFDLLRLPPLPGTHREHERIAKIAEVHHWSLDSKQGGDARELTLASMRAPRVLHLATHGFFLRPPEAKSGEPREASAPYLTAMQYSGVALAGAQSAVDAIRRNAPLPVADDGLLTADEVGLLDWEGTWLATLSACETGSGEIRAGEGVLGLRRGFVQAGVQNLLMTLWPINDTATVDIMARFYERALDTGDAAGSLAETQRAALTEIREKEGLLAAVRRAGAFILSSQGRR